MKEDPARAAVAPAADVRPFFHELLGSAMSHQRVAVRNETEVYLVGLLSDFLSTEHLFAGEEEDSRSHEPLAFMLKKAVEAPREERALHLRRMGDTALYVSGFFSDSLSRKLVDVDYYAQMGGRAYGALSGLTGRRGAGVVFDELASKFLAVVDLFNEISERTAVQSNTGILRLYERYVRTGSERLRGLLVARGLVATGPRSGGPL